MFLEKWLFYQLHKRGSSSRRCECNRLFFSYGFTYGHWPWRIYESISFISVVIPTAQKLCQLSARFLWVVFHCLLAGDSENHMMLFSCAAWKMGFRGKNVMDWF